jgi:hypothetical protein
MESGFADSTPEINYRGTIMPNHLYKSLLILPIMLGACASIPNGPSVQVLPGTGKSFDQFRADDASCRQYSLAQIGGTSANQAANNSMVGSAAAGTAIGAAIGAAAGGRGSTGFGAATGLLLGTNIGAAEANRSANGTQRQYDNAYVQCMYANGNRVPVYGHFVNQQPSYAPPPAPATYAPPPPPPDAPR